LTLPLLTTDYGSSPRLWGTRRAGKRRASRHRFIPTPVGNTLAIPAVAVILAVHPHACGEHAPAAGVAITADGSSPRLWGTPVHRAGAILQARFIPTPVGNTGKRSPGRRGSPVHPHACGEHKLQSDAVYEDYGSSPRLWGTPVKLARRLQEERFIPTPVGNTPDAGVRDPKKPVHPHACGEHIWRRINFIKFPGSSPRLWGTLMASSGR